MTRFALRGQGSKSKPATNKRQPAGRSCKGRARRPGDAEPRARGHAGAEHLGIPTAAPAVGDRVWGCERRVEHPRCGSPRAPTARGRETGPVGRDRKRPSARPSDTTRTAVGNRDPLGGTHERSDRRECAGPRREPAHQPCAVPAYVQHAIQARAGCRRTPRTRGCAAPPRARREVEAERPRGDPSGRSCVRASRVRDGQPGVGLPGPAAGGEI